MPVAISNLTATWSTSIDSVNTAIKMNVADIASAANSKILDLQVDGVSKFVVYKSGNTVANGVIVANSFVTSGGINLLSAIGTGGDVSAPFFQANQAFFQANQAFFAANNSGATAIGPAFFQANQAFAKANTANITADSAFDKANAANVLAFNSAAGANAWVNTVYGFTNSYTQAVGSAGNVYARLVGTAGNSYADSLFATSSGSAGAAFDKANAANLLAFNSAAGANAWVNTVYGFSNTFTHTIGGAAFAKSNTANITADLAFNKANAANVLAFNSAAGANAWTNTVYGFSNTFTHTIGGASFFQANQAFDKANSANVLAFNSAAGANAWVNTVYGFSNTFTHTIGGAAFFQANQAYNTGNTAAANALGAFTRSNVTWIHANASFDQANLSFAKANAANLLAFNSAAGANAWVNTVYGFTNTYTQTVGAASNSIAGQAFNKANAANITADAALPRAGGTISGDLVVQGNATFSGTLTYANTQTLLIGDNILVLNADLPVSVAPSENAGIEINRGSSTNVSVIWNEADDKWTFTNDGATFYRIASNVDVDSVSSGSISSFDKTNVSFFHANAAFFQANQAFAEANTSGNEAAGAFLRSNITFIHANASFFQANQAFDKANAANVLAFNALPNTSGSAYNGYLHFPTGNITIGVNANVATGPQGRITIRSSTLGENIGNSVTIISAGATTTSEDKLVHSIERTSNGTTWATATHKLTRVVDVTPMGYIGFGNFTDDLITFGEGTTEYMIIDGSGRVGIGNTSPTVRLQVDALSGSAIPVRISGASSGNNTQMRFYGNGAKRDLFAVGTDIATGDGSLVFDIYDLSNNANRFRVDPTGNVGIGILSPTSKLHVSGTANITSTLTLGTLNVADAIGNSYDKANAANVLAFNSAAGANAWTNTVYGFSNTFTHTIGGAAFGQANQAFNTGNTAAANALGAFTRANVTWIHANAAFDQANQAFSKANAANVLAFNALPKAGGTITGFLNVQNNFTITAGDFYINNMSGIGGSSEGGEIKLANSVSTTQILSGPISIDIYENKLRFFETNLPNRGAFINIASAIAGVGTDLLSSTSATDAQARSSAGAAFDKANAANVLAFNALPNTNGAVFNGTLTATTNLSADKIISTNNGNGENYKVGDDAWMGDTNLANAVRLKGQQNASIGYIMFGPNDGKLLGRAGTDNLTYDGNIVWHAGNDGTLSGLDADLLDGQHASYYATATDSSNAFGQANQAFAKANAGNVLAFNTAAGANAWTNTVYGFTNTYTQTVGTAGNNYSITIGASSNAWVNTVYGFGNTFTHTIGGAAFFQANQSFFKANAALANVAGISTAGGLVIPGILTSNIGGGGLQLRSGSTNDHVYIEYYPRSATSSRGAYVGYPSPSTNNFSIINETTTGTIQLGTAGGADITISSAGDVGIGTSSPAATLDVWGPQRSVNVTPVSGTLRLAYDGANSAGEFGSSLIFTQKWWSGATNQVAVGQIAGVKIAGDGNFGGGLAFSTSNGSTSTFAERLRITDTGNVGIGTASPAYKLHVNGSFAANTKSFVIDHPTKPDMKLRYGSLEGPENGVYVRGRIQGTTIYLPDYWTGLVDENSITVSLTPINKTTMPSVLSYDNEKIVLHSDNPIDCFYHVFGERKDVEKLVVEF